MRYEQRTGKWNVRCPKCKRMGELREHKNGSASIWHRQSGKGETQIQNVCNFPFWP